MTSALTSTLTSTLVSTLAYTTPQLTDLSYFIYMTRERRASRGTRGHRGLDLSLAGVATSATHNVLLSARAWSVEQTEIGWGYKLARERRMDFLLVVVVVVVVVVGGQ